MQNKLILMKIYVHFGKQLYQAIHIYKFITWFIIIEIKSYYKLLDIILAVEYTLNSVAFEFCLTMGHMVKHK